MAKDGKKIAIAVGLVAALGGIILLTVAKKPPIPPENIVLSDLHIEPSEVYVGESVLISVVATNTGEVAGSYEISCEVV